jgi:hypothetical protein
MPFGSVTLIPGVNVERTPTLNQAGISQSQLVRFKDSLVQKFGGWQKFYPFAVTGVPRALHAWQDLNQVSRLAVGTTSQFSVITNSALAAITPQTKTTNFAPNFTTTLSSPLVEVNDPNIANVTVYDSVFFNTPIAVTGSGIVLSGLYAIEVVTGVTRYQIRAATSATAAVAAVGAVPVFTTSSGSAVVSVALQNHGLAVGGSIAFPIPTTGNGVTVTGSYVAVSITNPNAFTIQVNAKATAGGAFSMNAGLARLVYYISIGPEAGGVGYGVGGYGIGGYGSGTVPASQTGTPIPATDWTIDNWGQLVVACPAGGGLYYWDPTGGFANMSLISSGPTFNSGCFVSTSQQILVAYGTTIKQNIGEVQDPLLVGWSDVRNFFEWRANSATLAGNYRIPNGSEIRGGMATPNQNLIWTDLDLWTMSFIGRAGFGFNKIGAGAGLASRHAAQPMRGGVRWMGQSNFYSYTSGGVQVIPCPVWDAVFQNINTGFITNVRAMPNTPFNEAGWLYPSRASVSGECDSYVKMNITDPSGPWDYGLLPRSAWMDQSVLGPPIGALPGGVIYQHETTSNADGVPLTSSFTTGYFYLSEGEDFVFVDQVYPDFKWGEFGQGQNAQIQLTFNVVNFPGEVPQTFGPYTVSQATTFVSTRFRGRQCSITVTSSDINSFWRLGKVRYRYSAVGRR